MHFVLPEQFNGDVYLNFQVIYIHLPRRIAFLSPFYSNALLLNSRCLYSRRQDFLTGINKLRSHLHWKLLDQLK